MPRKGIFYGLLGLAVLALLVVVIYRGAPGLTFAGGENNQNQQADKNPGEKQKEPEKTPEEIAKETGANELGRVPILVYHHIGEEEGRWTRTPENFRKDLEELHSRGYVLVPLSDYLKGEIDIPAGKSPAVITFDDSTPGHFRLLETGEEGEKNYEVDPDCAVGILKNFGEEHPEFGHAATFFVNSHPFSGEDGQEDLWKKKLKMLAEWNFEIGNHTYTHANMGSLSAGELQKEIAKLQDHIQQALPDYKPKTLAIVQDGMPDNYDLLIEGSYEDTEYKHMGVVKWAWRDAPSPYHKDFDPYRVQRIQVFNDNGESSLVNWLDRIEPQKYVSDGNKDIISVPESWKEELKDNPSQEVVTYKKDDPGRTPEGEEQAKNAKGIHVTFSYASSEQRWENLLSLVEDTQLNCIQLDVKDESGYIGYKSSVELAQEIGADRDMMPIREMLEDLRDRGIYSVARIVIFRDPVLAEKKPQYMVKNRNGTPLGGGVWVNPRNKEVWHYNVALAQEAYRLGFDEVQFDYIRFPEGRAAWDADYGPDTTQHRKEVIRDFLKYTRDKITWEKRLSATVFGFTSFASDDMKIGQRPEIMGPYLDFLSPMVYPSHYSPGNYGYSNPNANPYGVIDKSLKEFKGHLEHTGCELRPWLQAFNMGHPPYGREEKRAQINATENHGINTWLLWDPAVTYEKSHIKP